MQGHRRGQARAERSAGDLQARRCCHGVRTRIRRCPDCGVVPGNGSVTVVPDVVLGLGAGVYRGVGSAVSCGTASTCGLGASIWLISTKPAVAAPTPAMAPGDHEHRATGCPPPLHARVCIDTGEKQRSSKVVTAEYRPRSSRRSSGSRGRRPGSPPRLQTWCPWSPPRFPSPCRSST